MTPPKYRVRDRVRFRFGATEGEGRIVGTTEKHCIIDTEGRGEALVPHGAILGLAKDQRDPRVVAQAKVEAEAVQQAAARRAIEMRKAAEAWRRERSLVIEEGEDFQAGVQRIKRWLHGEGAHELLMRKAEPRDGS